MEVSTTKQPRVNELMTLRRVETPSDAICLLLHGISLAKGQGTPLLRSGIHRIHENQEYIDSDEYTEWPGFVNIDDEDDEAAPPLSTDNTYAANQGDNECSS
ncbi:unnamed protein product [Trichobilharzia regenti]|nr:unnamed protein product [Trichobilharzia regenti]